MCGDNHSPLMSKYRPPGMPPPVRGKSLLSNRYCHLIVWEYTGCTVKNRSGMRDELNWTGILPCIRPRFLRLDADMVCGSRLHLLGLAMPPLDYIYEGRLVDGIGAVFTQADLVVYVGVLDLVYLA